MSGDIELKSALLPCPFCGGAARFIEDRNRHKNDGEWDVRCDGCDAVVGREFSCEAALAAWNRRDAPEPHELAELVRDMNRFRPDSALYGMARRMLNAYTRLSVQASNDRKRADRLSALSIEAPSPQSGEGMSADPPEPPWTATSENCNNAKREGWSAFWAGRGRDACTFPRARRDLQAGYVEGWDRAEKFSKGRR